MSGDVGFNTTSFLDGNFKHIYPNEGIKLLVPNFLHVQNKIPFDKADLLGKLYHQPVDLTTEHGLTFAAPGAGAFTLNDPVAAQMQDAQVDGSQILLRSSMDYETVFKAANGGKQAFAKTTAHIVKRMVRSVSKALEHSLLYGRKGLGIVSAQSGSGATRTITITAASWAAATWAGMENCSIEVANAGNTALVCPTSTNAYPGVTSINLDSATRAIVLGTAPNGSAPTSTDLDAIVAGTLMFRKGQALTNEMVGMATVAGNTSSTLFNISATAYNLWAGNAVTSFGQPNLGRILNALTKAIVKGLEDDVVVLMPAAMFEVLNTDQSTLRMFDGTYNPNMAKTGNRALTFYSQVGSLEVLSHPYVRDGDAFIVCPKEWKRIGSTEVSFNRDGPGGAGGIFRELTDKAGFELRCYTGQAIFSEAPAHSVYITGATYAT